MTAELDALADHGPLVRAVRAARPRGAERRLSWLAPPVLRAIEYGTILAVAQLADPPATTAAFALVAVLAWHHYDLVYRRRHRGATPPAGVTIAGGGWELRTLIVLVAGALGVVGPVLWALAGALAVIFVPESISGWVRHQRQAAS